MTGASIRIALFVAVFAAFSCRSAQADEIVLPAHALDRAARTGLTYRLDTPGTGEGVLGVLWSDADGRVVERRNIRFALDHQTDVTFHLDTRRAVTMLNTVDAHLDFVGVASRGASDRREGEATASFIVKPADRPWTDYQIIMWQPQTPSQYAALKELGVSAGKEQADRAHPRDIDAAETGPLLKSGLPWYVENIATDFYSAYHRWFPGRQPNWRFVEIQKRYADDPRDPSLLKREPSLSDPAWLERIRARVTDVVRSHRDFRPLFYDLGDETGIADLAAFWDFDYSDDSLTGMRQWLKRRYLTLAALNNEWGSDFASWDAVMPITTAQAMERRDDNFAPWADFKEWMDAAFARALRVGTDAVHAADPTALAAIEGTQPPGWGGYDYTRLAHSVDVMEMYDSGENVDIVRSLNPKIAILTTSAGGGPAEEHRVWRELLHGGRGLILWDDKHEFVREDGTPGDRGLAAAPYFREIRGGIGALLMNSRALTAPVAILYSPASMRVQWMLDWKSKGDAWSRRDSEREGGGDNTVRSALHAYTRMVERVGLAPRFVSPGLIEAGALRRGGYRVLILPHAVALSAQEAREIRDFVERGGMILADSEPGRFDAHGRKLGKPLLEDLFRSAPTGATISFAFGKGKAVYLVPEPQAGVAGSAGDSDALLRLRGLLESAQVAPSYAVRRSGGEPVTDVETHLFADGDVTIIALQRDLASGSGPGEAVTLSLPQPAFIYDLRRHEALGRHDRVALVLDPVTPSFLAFSKAALASPTLSVPSRADLGSTVQMRFGFAGQDDRALHVLRIEVIDPAGKPIQHYSGNILASGGAASTRLPLALNDPSGKWQVRVTDVLSGTAATAEMTVAEP